MKETNKKYLTEKEVKEYIWKEFKKFMKGQTLMINKGKIVLPTVFLTDSVDSLFVNVFLIFHLNLTQFHA